MRMMVTHLNYRPELKENQRVLYGETWTLAFYIL